MQINYLDAKHSTLFDLSPSIDFSNPILKFVDLSNDNHKSLESLISIDWFSIGTLLNHTIVL